ncbi:LOG family protein ygdH [Raoultella planticola]|uniref:LOG family protein ygdH n=1 Tax=Raoultella planticola TaxID=575 RepID=A0A485BVA2_RAOPL|nr:LOG family protein ygdH [Raoultella planticola]
MTGVLSVPCRPTCSPCCAISCSFYGQIHNTVRFPNLDLESSVHITNLVFSILRNARALHVGEAPNMIVCWGRPLD